MNNTLKNFGNVFLPEVFKPSHNYDIIRLGQNNDGGYLVSEKSINESNILLSAGISYDFSFENDYVKKTNNIAECFDHTINNKHYFLTWFSILIQRIILFSGSKKITQAFKNILNPIKFYKFTKNNKINFHKKAIGYGDERYVGINEIIDKYPDTKKIFIKLDIEGDEYRILNDLVRISNRLSGLVIEFHFVDLHIDKIINFINKIDLTLIHVHVNNAGPIIDENLPTLIECSFAKDPKIKGSFENSYHVFDQPNKKNRKEFIINYK